jgi:hypothetical protein
VAAAAACHWCGRHCELPWWSWIWSLNECLLVNSGLKCFFWFAFGNERFSDLEKYIIHLHFLKTRVHMWPRSDVSISIMSLGFYANLKKTANEKKIQCTQFANDFHVKKKLIMNFCCWS